MCVSVIQTLTGERITLQRSNTDNEIYTPDGDQSVEMTKDVLMKMYNGKAAKEEDKSR